MVLKDVIAIDGPAGVGKSSVARQVAKELGFLFVNTGDMYRALTWHAIGSGVDIRSAVQVSKFLKHSMDWTFKRHDGALKIFLDGKELGRELRSERVSRQTPTVAQYPAVRKYLRHLQREAALLGRAVLEGRDITTHVTADAAVKIYLDAPVEERARRRYHQLHAEGSRVKLSSIEAAVRQRDYREIKRKILPTVRSAGTVTLDTTHMSMHEVVAAILSIYRGRAA